MAALGLLIAALALVAAGCGGGDGGGAPEALPSSSCTGMEYEGDGDPDLLIASDLPMQGPSRVVTEQMVAAVRQVLDNYSWKAGDYNIAYQACDDSTAQAANYDTGKCSQNGNAYAINDKLVGVLGTYNSPCAAIIIPLLNKAKGGEDGTPNSEAIPMLLGGEHVAVPHREPRRCVRGERNGQVLPDHDAELPARRSVGRLPGRLRRRVREGPGRHEGVHPQRQGVVRRGCRRNDQESNGVRGDRDRRRRGVEPEGIELRGPDEQDQGHRGRRDLPRGTHLRERRSGDQGQGRGARPERRRREAARTRRVRERSDDRRVRWGSSRRVLLQRWCSGRQDHRARRRRNSRLS